MLFFESYKYLSVLSLYMKRKIVRHGPSTLTISIPMDFAMRNNIHAGDEIEISESEGKLIIGSKKDIITKGIIKFFMRDRKLQLNTVGNKRELLLYHQNLTREAIRILVATAYKFGIDELEIYFDDSKVAEILQQQIREVLIGFEIVDQGFDFCIIRNIAKEDFSNLTNLIDRLHQILKSMSAGVYQCVLGKKNIAKYVVEMELMSNKIENLCERMLNKNRFCESTLKLYTLCKGLEAIGDRYRDLCLLLDSINLYPLRREYITLIEDVCKITEGFYNLFKNFDLDVAIEVDEQRKEILKNCYNLLKDNKNFHEALLCSFSLSILHETEKFVDVIYQGVL